MILHVSVCPQGGSTWAGSPLPGQVPPRQVHPLSRYIPWAGTPPGRYPQAGTPPWAGTSWAGTPLGRYAPLGRYTPWAGTPPGQVHPLGRCTPWAGTPPGQVQSLTTVHAGIQSTSGQYTSHWNAFLLMMSPLCFKAKMY